jgi:peroxin-3
MVKSLCESMRTELYTSDDLVSPATRRLVDCLPEMATWSKGVWNGIPDSGVEVSHLSIGLFSQLTRQGLVSLPEYESFAALVFGDWA